MRARGLGIAALLAAAGCGGEAKDGTDATTIAEVLRLPPQFPVPRVPEENPVSAEKIALGRRLFYDVRLSGNGTQSCGSCHFQERAFAEPRATSIGSTGEVHPRNANALVNVAFNASLTWANPILTDLETQIRVPLFGETPIELGAGPADQEILARLAADPAYPPLFTAAFGDAFTGAVTWDQVVFALATFVRALVSADAPFDRYVYGDQTDALGPAELRGMELFFSERLECHHCHGGFNFTGSTVHADSLVDPIRFHNTGLYDLDGAGAYPPPNTGVHEVTGRAEDMGRFRAPSLRNVAVTAPYMHDGSVETLDEVIRIYEAGGRNVETGPFAGDGRANPLKSGFVPGFTLTEDERADLLAFLRSLTDETFLTDPAFSDPFEGDVP